MHLDPLPMTQPLAAELTAPVRWQMLDFVSDLHLQASEVATRVAFERYLTQTPADALFILGDLFEVWVGDDAATPSAPGVPCFEHHVQALLARASQRLSLHFLPGNRDFLLGPAFAQGCALQLLADPTLLHFDERRWLLSHGDAGCLADTDYQDFRAQVRSPAWQHRFLAQPLAQRQAQARALRTQSEARKASGVAYADLDETWVTAWLDRTGAQALIHGHTHRPADHTLPTSGASTAPRMRHVLSDWDARATPPKLQVLRLQQGQMPRRIAVVG
jgi:UDP-2,3-diacylglucosamine hydrolase